MELVLQQSDFVNNRFTVNYGLNRQAQFVIVDMEFQGANEIGRLNHIVILTRETTDGAAGEAAIASSVIGTIGIGNRVVGVRSSNRELIGKRLSKDNMGECRIILYED